MAENSLSEFGTGALAEVGKNGRPLLIELCP